jgi:hypothetical protein
VRKRLVGEIMIEQAGYERATQGGQERRADSLQALV